MKRFVFGQKRVESRAQRTVAWSSRCAAAALLLVACAQIEDLEPSTSSAIIGDPDASTCGAGQCSTGGASHTGGAGGNVQTGGVPQSGGMPQTGGVAQNGGAPSTGGVATGGTGTGGATPTGGAGGAKATGGASTGGTSTGGTSTGGTSTGGKATGGTSTGGTATGGTSTGGTATGGAGTGGGSACPNYPTDDNCSRCICSKCATQVATCFSSTDSNKNQQCKQIQDCAEEKRCASTPCLCGANDPLCLSQDGACASVIQTVVGSNNLQTIIDASNDTNHPLNRANQIGICSTNNCRSECGL